MTKYKLKAKLWNDTRIWALSDGQYLVKNQWNPNGFFCTQRHAENLVTLMTGSKSQIKY